MTDERSLTIDQNPQDAVQHLVEVTADILGKETEDEIPVFLQQPVLSTITAISRRIGQMLGAVKLDRQAGIGVEQIDFHSSPSVERDRQLNIQKKSAGSLRQGFQPPE
jgi:hypothetical protein